MTWSDYPCVEWPGHVDENGYGRAYNDRQAHVLIWQGTFGRTLRPKHSLDHLCHTYADPPCPGGRTDRHRRCVQPYHLEEVTIAENNRRSNSPWAINGRKQFCKDDHEFTPENTRITPDGRRRCRKCHRNQQRRARARGKTRSTT
jgi:hypothetical protein